MSVLPITYHRGQVNASGPGFPIVIMLLAVTGCVSVAVMPQAALLFSGELSALRI